MPRARPRRWRAEPAGKGSWQPNVRFGDGDRATLERLASDAGVSAPRLIRETAARYAKTVAAELKAEKGREVVAGSAGANDEAQSVPAAATSAYDLAAVLVRHTGMPRALIVRAIAGSRVTVDGAVYREPTITREQIDAGLALDGIAV